jgi:hypothetical protein
LRKFSITLTSVSGPITFAVMGNMSKQIDLFVKNQNHENFDAAVKWALEQVEYVLINMNGKIVDGYDESLFTNPWSWRNPNNPNNPNQQVTNSTGDVSL